MPTPTGRTPVDAPETPTERRKTILGTRLVEAYYLQSLAGELLPSHRVAQCLRAIAPGYAAVDLVWRSDLKRPFYRHLFVCERLWECPPCASRISEARRREMLKAIENAAQLGLYPVLITYTLRHFQGEKLRVLKTALRKARNYMRGTRRFKDFVARWGLKGTINSFEVLFGDCGPHPHFHEVGFLDRNLQGDDLDTFRAELTRMWLDALERFDREGLWDYALDVSARRGDLVEYVTKYGHLPEDEKRWGAAAELTKGVAKRSHPHGRTWLELLRDYGNGDGQAGEYFVEYAEAMKNERQLYWSPGLKHLLGVQDEQPDMEVLDPETLSEYEQLLLRLFAAPWWHIVRRELRAQLWLKAYEFEGDVTRLKAWLKQEAGLDLDNLGHVDLAELNDQPPARAERVTPAPVETDQLNAMLESSW